MKAVVERSVLARALAFATGVVERRNTIPILANVLIEAEAGGEAGGEGVLTILATDLDRQMRMSVPARVEEAGATTVAAQLLADVVCAQDDGAQIGLAQQDGRLAVTAGRTRARLATLPRADFPLIAAGEATGAAFEMEVGALARLLDKVAYAQCEEEARWYLNGILFQAGEMLEVAATNGHLLATAALALPEGAGGMDDAIVSRKTVAVLQRMIGDHDGPVGIAFPPGKVRFAIGAMALTSKLINGSFPDWRRVIPQTTGRTLRVGAAALEGVVRRVVAVAPERKRTVKWAIGSDRLTISTRSPEHGEAVEEAACVYDGAPIEIGFDARYLLDTISAMGGGEVEIAMTDAAGPTLFTNPADTAARWVVMPRRV